MVVPRFSSVLSLCIPCKNQRYPVLCCPEKNNKRNWIQVLSWNNIQCCQELTRCTRYTLHLHFWSLDWMVNIHHLLIKFHIPSLSFKINWTYKTAHMHSDWLSCLLHTPPLVPNSGPTPMLVKYIIQWKFSIYNWKLHCKNGTFQSQIGIQKMGMCENENEWT